MRLGWKRTTALAVTLLLAAPAWAKGIDDFTLAKAIPGDAFLTVCSRGHEGKAWVEKQWTRVWEEFEKARLDRDLKKIFKGMQEGGGDAEAFDAQWQKLSDLATSVEWGKLGDREYAFAMKLGFPTPEFVSLMMPPADKVKESFEGLTGVLKTLSSLDETNLVVATEDAGGVTIHRLSVNGAPFPIGLTLALHKDVILVGFGTTMVEQTLALLQGKGGESVASGERFKTGMGKVPAPTDNLAFVDIARLMSQLRGLMDQVMQMSEPHAPKEGEEGFQEYTVAKKLPAKIFDMFDMFEYSAASSTTQGMKSDMDSITILRDDAKSHAFYPVFFGNGTMKDPLKYIPAKAGDFSVSSGIDVQALYKLLTKFLKEDVPHGDEALAHLDAVKEQGFDIEADLIDWLKGDCITVSVPGPTPYSPGDWVFLLGARDEAKAKAALAKLIGIVEPMLAGQSGSIAEAEIEGAEGFKSIVVPALAMFGMNKPTLGVKDGWMFLASSPEMITMVLETASGKADNISKSERFQKEGLPPEGNLVSLSFTDQTKMGEQIGQVLQMVPLITAMQPDIARDPTASAAINMIGKLGRVAKKLDFFQSTASRTTMDGNTLATKTIVNYREPPAPMKPASEASENPPKEE